MADKDKLRFLTGQEANLKDKTLTRGQVYFAISSDTDSGKIYFDAPIDNNTTKRILMSSDHAKTADKATAADRATADSNGHKFTETYVSEIKLDNAGTTILYKYPDITTWKELKPKFLPLTGGTITGELYADSITAGDLLVNGSARFVNTILGNIETANQWKTARGFQIADSDAAHTSVTVNVNGSSNVVLKLPSTIKATLEGNASSANKVNHKYTLTLGTTKQTAFDGSADVAITITPESIGALSKDEASAGAAKWSTARMFYVADADASNTGTGVSVDGSKDITLKLPSTIKASITGHASEDLPLAGGTMTGNISYKGSKATNSMIRFLNNTTDTSGNGISIGGGGVTVIGAGESSQNLTPAANEESLYLTSDGSIKFYTYCDTIGNKRGVILDTSRNFYPDVNNSGSIGTSSNKWNSMYATTFYGALSGTASHATSDIRGNAIINTYLTNVYAKSDDSSYLYKQVGPSSERSAELIGRYTPLDSDGLINMKYIPAAALERVVVVANQTAQYALTTANVQLGDVVKRNDTGQLYFVVDTNNLGNAGGYLQFTAGTAANVNWSGILNRPNIVGRATGNAIVPNTANTEFTVYQVNGNGTSTSYVIKPNFLPKTGGTITGELYVDGGTTLASLLVNGDARFVNIIQGSISGNAGSATKWATAKAFYIADAEAKHTSSPQVNIDGSQSSYTLKLPSTIKATLEGNADTATKLTNLTEADKASSTNTWRRVWFAYDDNVNGRPAYSDTFAYQSSTGTVKATKFQGALVGNATSADKWSTARSFITNLGSESSASVDGSTGPYNLGVTGVLPVSHGGTGQTDLSKVSVGNADKLDGYHEDSFLRYRDTVSGSGGASHSNTLWGQIGIRQYNNALPDEMADNATYTYGAVISLPGTDSRLDIWYNHQTSANGNGLRYRTGWNDDKKAWATILDTINFNNYAVKKASSSTDNAIVRWDGTDGRRIQNSLLSISDEGLLTLQTGNHIGAKLGSAYITSADASSGEIVLQNGHLRFGSDSWDYSQWAGLKYIHSSKTIYLGLADGTIFTANSAQSGGTLALPGIRYFSINGKIVIDANDGWLRINEGKAFATGVYFGSNVVRTDDQLQVGSSGSKFYANSSGNGYFSNTLGIGGTNTSYKLYVNGTSYINGNTTINGWLKVQNTTDSKNSQDSNASLSVQGGVSVAKQLSAKTIRIDGSSSDTIGSTTQGCTVHFNKTNNCIEFVFD